METRQREYLEEQRKLHEQRQLILERRRKRIQTSSSSSTQQHHQQQRQETQTQQQDGNIQQRQWINTTQMINSNSQERVEGSFIMRRNEGSIDSKHDSPVRLQSLPPKPIVVHSVKLEKQTMKQTQQRGERDQVQQSLDKKFFINNNKGWAQETSILAQPEVEEEKEEFKLDRIGDVSNRSRVVNTKLPTKLAEPEKVTPTSWASSGYSSSIHSPSMIEMEHSFGVPAKLAQQRSLAMESFTSIQTATSSMWDEDEEDQDYDDKDENTDDESVDDDDDEEEEYFPGSQEDVLSCINSLRQFINGNLGDGVGSSEGGFASVEDVIHNQRLEGQISSSEIAAKAMLKQAHGTVVALKEHVQDLECKLRLANDEIDQLELRVQRVEVHRLLLGIACGVSVPLLVAALLSHHWNFHEWEITWVLLSGWMLFLYVLSFVFLRLIARLRNRLDEGQNAYYNNNTGKRMENQITKEKQNSKLRRRLISQEIAV